MLLDLYITHWNEPWEVCRPGFEMLKNQRCVDPAQLRVTVVHDGTKCFNDELFRGYPFFVNQVSITHRGIAGARNWCLDDAKAEWIKMNDCDDFFTGAYSLRELMSGLEQGRGKYDLMWFETWVETDGNRYLRNARDPVVLHGKAFRTAYIREKGLRFQEELTWCEDSAFLAVMEMDLAQERIGKITGSCPMYTWTVRQGSLCHRPEIRWGNLRSFFDRHCYVAGEMRKRGMEDLYRTMVARTMCDSYYALELADVPDDRSEHREKVRAWVREHLEDLMDCRESEFERVIDAANLENRCSGISRDAVLDWANALAAENEE